MPRCHASSSEIRGRYNAADRVFRDAYLRAAHRLRRAPAAARTDVARPYPPGSLARPGWYFPAPARFQPPWLTGRDDADAFAVAN